MTMEIDPSDQPAVLLVEDNPGDVRLIEHSIQSDGGTVFETPTLTQVKSLAGAEAALEEGAFDLVLLDLGLPKSSGLATLERLKAALEEIGLTLPVVVLTGLDDQQTALDAIRAGAQDYLVKGDIEGETLERSIRHALERYRQERELERQNERLDRFASVVSHDLRNPLNVAKGTVAALAADTDDERLETEFDRILGAHDRMEAIIDDVLTLARQGQAVDEMTPVSLPALLEDCQQTMATTGLTLEVEYDGEVLADPSRLRQLLENLLRNAAEHGSNSAHSLSTREDGTEHGSSGPTSATREDAAGPGGSQEPSVADPPEDALDHDEADVTVTVGRLEDGFFVADDGPGIQPEHRQEIFDAGFTTGEDGTGFGLNIVKDIAEAHGWRVRVTEGADGGARFEITGVEIP